MAIADLLDALAREAEAERAAILAEARADAARVLAEAGRRRGDDHAAALAAFRAERQRAADVELTAAARRWRGEVLAARAAALDRLYLATRDALPALLAAAPVVGALIDAIVEATGDQAAVVRCPPVLLDAVHAQLGARPDLTVTVDPTAGSGLRAELTGGAVAIDATLETLLDRHWPRLRQRAPGRAGVAP